MLFRHLIWFLLYSQAIPRLGDLKELAQKNDIIKLVLHRVSLYIYIQTFVRSLAVFNEVVYDLSLYLKLMLKDRFEKPNRHIPRIMAV